MKKALNWQYGVDIQKIHFVSRKKDLIRRIIDFYFLFLLLKSRDEWTFEVMDSGIKYKIKKEKQLANTKRQPPTYESEAFVGNLNFSLLIHILIFVVGSSCPGCMPFG